jgi:hypothetical protein
VLGEDYSISIDSTFANLTLMSSIVDGRVCPIFFTNLCHLAQSVEQRTFEMPKVEKTQNNMEITRQKLMLRLEEILLKSIQNCKHFLIKKR